MTCPHCGYAMSAFDAECPRCHGKGVPKPPTGAPPPYSPPPQYPQPQPAVIIENRSGGFSTGMGAGLGVCFGCILLPFLFLTLIGGLTAAGKREYEQNKTAPQFAPRR